MAENGSPAGVRCQGRISSQPPSSKSLRISMPAQGIIHEGKAQSSRKTAVRMLDLLTDFLEAGVKNKFFSLKFHGTPGRFLEYKAAGAGAYSLEGPRFEVNGK